MNDENAALREALWKMYLEHCTHVRHHEAQRSTVAGALIAIAAALIGLATFDRALTPTDIPLTAFLCVLGLFGAVFSAKQWERASMHTERARAYRNKADNLLGGTVIFDLKQKADKAHNEEFPKLHTLRLHKFWIGLHLLVALLAVVLTIVAVFSPIANAP